jgi:hypothetical protein
MPRRALLSFAAAAGLSVAAIGSAVVAQSFNPWNNNNVYLRSMSDNWGAPNNLGQLAANEGIYVNVTDFSIAKGAPKGDPAANLAKSGAREVADGAIIFRSGNKLYIVDGKPAQ